MTSEVSHHADFSQIRYAQCWEDADILLEALAIKQGGTYLSIASAGDNALAMASKGAERVIALDLNPSQLYCLELRIAAYKELSHPALLELIGSRPSSNRDSLYQRCCPLLSKEAKAFWDAHPKEIATGIGGAGKFERYFSLFRNRVIPLIHSKKRVKQLLAGGTKSECTAFYDKHWNNLRWNLMFRIFFSRFVMGRLGRDPSFFRYAEGSVAESILARTRYALTELNPADNPYLQWILTGQHTTALPYALREENFEAIRSNIDCIEGRCQSVEDYLEEAGENAVDGFNLSDIFEYMSDDNYVDLLKRIVFTGRPGGRLAYWNMRVPRSRPEEMANTLTSLGDLASKLHGQDKAFFYSAFIVEEILG